MRNELALIAHKDQRTKDLYEFFKGHPYTRTILNPSNPENSVVVSSEFPKQLDPSNQLTLLARGQTLTKKELRLLPRLNTIVAHTSSAGYQIAWQVKVAGFNTRVIHLLPYIPVPQAIYHPKTIYYDDLGPIPKQFFGVHKLQNQHPNARVRIDLGDVKKWPYHIIESMRMGVPPIVWDKPPYSDFIIHGHNGYLIRTPGDIAQILSDLDNTHDWVSTNARNTMNAQYDPVRYYNALTKPERVANLNVLGKIKLEHDDRKWIVRERIFRGARIDYFPKEHHELFQTTDLNSVEEVLEFFSEQLFSEVYVFGCDFPPTLTPEETNRMRRLINGLGVYSRKLHFCVDTPMPDDWLPLFGKLSVISVQEGLKQVSK
jgi:hypothetical protein